MKETLEKRVVIQGIELSLALEDIFPFTWIGQRDVLDQLLACWTTIHERDLPLNPRLVGKPGVGKTTLAYAAAKKLNRKVFIFQCTMDTRPEDLLISPVIDKNGGIRYAASSLVSAMIEGGVSILDEANRMNEKAWASLAPLLDLRRTIESQIAGIKIEAHPDFRVAATMNDDASTYELPDYISSRLQPTIWLEFPEKEEEMRILKEAVPFADNELIEYIVNFLQRCHLAEENFSVRDGINIARYALKRIATLESGEKNRTPLLREALFMVLGDQALQYVD